MDGKGMVCRVKSRSAVVLTGDFEFVEIRRRPGMEVGQEVRFSGADLMERRALPRVFALAATLTVLLLISVFALPRFAADPPPVYAYVSVEVNPGVELALDRELAVVAVEALNAGGAAALGTLELEGLPVTEAVAALVRAWHEKGYLGSDTRHLVVTTVLEEEKAGNGTLLQARLLEVVRHELEGTGGRTEVYVLECGPEIRERAREMALSTAHYVIWEQARKQGLDIAAEAVRAGKLREALALRGRDFGAAVAALATMRARVGPEREVAPDEPGETEKPRVRLGSPGLLKKNEAGQNRTRPVKPEPPVPVPVGPRGAPAGKEAGSVPAPKTKPRPADAGVGSPPLNQAGPHKGSGSRPDDLRQNGGADGTGQFRGDRSRPAGYKDSGKEMKPEWLGRKGGEDGNLASDKP